MIPKFRVWDLRANLMYDVKSVLYTLNIIKSVSDKAMIKERTFCLEVDDIRVMESTGLKDVNGVDIFDSDIITFENDNSVYVVRLSQGTFYLVHKGNYLCPLYDKRQIAIVQGNIYENPELLEVEK